MRKGLGFVLLLYLLLLVASALPADQQPVFETLSLEQGLSQLSVNSIIQDYRGIMWFGTRDGLNKYDGYHFKIFRPNPDDPTTISDTHVRVILEDKQDKVLWLATKNGGLSKMDLNREVFTTYRHDPDNPSSLSYDEVFALYRDKRGVMWLGTWGGGLERFNEETGEFIHYRHDPARSSSLGHDIVRAIFEDKDGAMWIGTYGGGLDKFDRETGTFQHYRHEPDRPDSLSDDRVMIITQTRDGTLWLGTDGGGINSFDPATGRFTCFTHQPDKPGTLSYKRIRSIFEDRDGALWVGTYGGGLNRFYRKTGTFAAYRNNPRDLGTLVNDQVLCIFEDNTRILWIGTHAGGISKLDLMRKKFGHVHAHPEDPEGLSSSKIRAFTEDAGGNLWVGTYGGGLNKLDRKKNVTGLYRNDPSDPGSLMDDRIFSLFQDKDDNILWVGTFGGGLCRLDKQKETFTTYLNDPRDPESLSDNRIRCISGGSEGLLWLGTWQGGVNAFDRKSGKFKAYRHDADDPTSISHDTTFAIYPDRGGNLWFGTFGGGLNRFNREQDSFSRYRHEVKNPNSLSNDRVFCFFEDRDGYLWMGTGGGGLSRFDWKKNLWKTYTTNDGLPSDVIYGILEDKKNNLWLSTNGGLSQFDPVRVHFRNYDTEDGVQSNEFNGGAYFKSPEGEMFFGGMKGFNYFYPSEIRNNPYVPTVLLTDFKIFNRSVWFDSVLASVTDIDLSYRENFISFEFAALNYRATENNKYAYKMEGFDSEWVYCGTRHSTSYTNLAGGNYVFRVKAANNDGLWNEAGTSVRVWIIPPFWKTWWLRLLAGVLLAGFIFALYQFRTYTIRRRNKELKAINTRLNLEVQERRKAEDALRKSEEKFRSIFENSIDAFYRADLDGNLLMISPAGVRLLGYENEAEISGNTIADSFYTNPKDRERFIEELEKRGSVMNHEITLKRKNGDTLIAESNSRYIFDDLNRPVMVEGVFRDVTRRKQAENENFRLQEQLHDAKKMEAVGTLAGGMAHEFNNLMAVIIGNANILETHLMEDMTLRQVQSIIKSGTRCAEMIDQLLSFSRKQMLRLEELDINTLLKDMSGNIQRAAGKDIEVQLIPDPGIQMIKGDREMLTQVLMGMVHNARDAMPEGGTVTLKTSMADVAEPPEDPGTPPAEEGVEIFGAPAPHNGKYVCLSIEDTGIGMTQETAQHIFEPFFTTKAEGKGVGLALSFVYGTIKQHNGWIDVQSTPGQGTAFTIFLPAV